jgi:nucleoside 2-deoxyribosyltransferase
MAAFQNMEKYNQNINDTKKLENTLKEECKFKSVFYPGEKIESPINFDAPDIAAKTDVQKLVESKYFVLYYPEKCVSSVLFEAGVALALQKPCVYFVKDRDHLPFLMRNAEQAFKNVKIYQCDTIEKTLSLIKKNRNEIFP